MASNKVLSITIRTIDQATAPIRAVIRQVGDLGGKALSVMTSLKAAAVAFAAVFISGAIAGAFKKTVDRIDEMAERARQLGLTAESLSVFEYSAKLANVAQDELYNGFRKGTENVAEFAATMSGPAKNVIREYGLELVSVTGQARSLSSIIEEVANKTATLPAAERLRVYMDIFGKGGQAIERLTAGGAFSQYRKELEALGGLVTPDKVAAAKKLSDAMDRVSIAWDGLKAKLLVPIAEPLSKLFNTVAFQLAKLPDLISAGIRAVDQILSGGPQAAQSKELLIEFGGAFADAILITIKEAGNLLLTIVVDAAATALTYIAPMLQDVFQDAWAVVTRQSGFLKDADWSASKQIAELITRNEAITKELQAVWMGKSGRIIGQKEAEELRAMQQERVDNIAKIATLEDDLTARRNASVASYKQGAREVGEAWESAFKNIPQAWRDVFKSVDGLINTLKPKVKSDFAGFFQVDSADVAAFHLGEATAEEFMKGWGGVAVADVWKKNFLDDIEDLQSDLQVRMLQAQGRGDEAGRLQLVLQQQKERVDLNIKLGASYATVRQELEAVQAAELRRYDTSAAAKALMDELRAAETRYSTSVQTRAALVDAGTITAQRANEVNEDAVRLLTQLGGSTREQLEAMLATAPELHDVLAPALREVVELMTRLGNEQRGIKPNTWTQGWADGLEAIRKKADDVRGFMADAMVQVAESMSSGLSNAILDVITGVSSLKDAMKQFLSQTLRMVSQLILQFLILKMISGFLGPAAGGGGNVTGSAGAGVTIGAGHAMGGPIPFPKFAGGGFIGGPNMNKDTRLILAAGGEHVINRAGVRANSRSTLDYMNHGGKVSPAGGGGGMTINQTFHVSGGGGADQVKAIKAAAKEGVREALANDPNFRDHARRHLGAA